MLEGQLVGRMLLPRLATGATSIKQVSSEGTCTRMPSEYYMSLVCVCVVCMHAIRAKLR